MQSNPVRASALVVAIAVAIAIGVAAGALVQAEVPSEQPGTIATLPEPRAHWIWVSDLLLERSALIDLDEGRFLGMIEGGYGNWLPLFPGRRAEIYIAGTYYSRRSRGERTDTLTVFDRPTLAPVDEVVIPPRRAISAVALAHAGLSDDERFVAVLNGTPGLSLSIVDVERRAFVGEIPTPGCSLVYPAGPRRFLMLCGDGAGLTVTLDAQGLEAGRVRSEPFFDPIHDPVTEKAVRWGDRWLFVSFEGWLHVADASAETITFEAPWSLLDDDDRADGWRIGGRQHLAVHESSGRLFSLVHRGEDGSHKESGEELWVYDLKTRKRTQRIELVSPGVTVMGVDLIGDDWFTRWLVDSFVPAAVDRIAVTQDHEPLLVTASDFSGSLGIYDARSGEFVGRVAPVGMTSGLLIAPFGGAPRS